MKKALAVCTTALLALSAVALSATAANADEEKLPICHSGSGAHWGYIAPDANGYNGHQNHELDIYGLTEAECLAKNPVVLTEWHTWVIPSGAAIVPSGDSRGNGWAVGADGFPQPYLGAGQIAPQCGQKVQQDKYKGEREEIDGILDGNELTQGEDYDYVKQWIILVGDPCPLDPPSGDVVFTASYCDGITPVGNSSAVLTLGEGTTASYAFNGGASQPIAAGTYSDLQVGTYVVTLLGEDGTTLERTVIVPDPKVVLDCLTLVRFVAPTFTEAEGCDTYGSITPTEQEGVVWTVVFNQLTGSYTVDAAPAYGVKFEAEVQTHWEGTLGAFTPCPEIEYCESSVLQPVSTDLNPLGWEIVGGEYVDGGVLLTASNWSDAYAYHATDFKLSEAANLDLDLDINGAGVWAVILETAAGTIHYEPEPYTLDLWTNAAGILPLSPGGQGGTYAGNLDDIISDPQVTGGYLYFSTGSESSVTALLHSGSYNCVTQPFDKAEVVKTPPPTPLASTGTDPANWLFGAGAAVLLGMIGLGISAVRRRAHL